MQHITSADIGLDSLAASQAISRTRTLSQLARKLSGETVSALAALIPRDSPIALVDHPSHANVGDHAIWLGERRALARLRATTRYVCSVETYNRSWMASAIGHSAILIHGGGNFGDLWPLHQRLREEIIRDFPNNRIIQLPQSVWFDDPANASTIRSYVRAHGGVTIMVRDRQSRQRVRDFLDIDAVLCPDIAFALEAIKRRHKPSLGAVVLRRKDKEASNQMNSSIAQEILGMNDPVPEYDWLDRGGLEAFLGGADSRYRSVFRPSFMSRLLRPGLYDLHSLVSLRRGMRILEKGRVVVTDRLHAFILCILAGIPVLPVDNRVLKISAFASTWFPEHAAEWFPARRDIVTGDVKYPGRR